MNGNKFQILDDTNLFLGNVTGYADKAFANLQGGSQTTVNVASAEVAYGMSKGIEFSRQATIKALHKMYKGYTNTIGKLSTLANMSITDPLALLQPVLEIVKIVTTPYYEALTFVTELTPKVVELSNNMQKIANYRPPKLDVNPTPGLFEEYLTVGSITMGEITSGVPNPVKLKVPDIDEIRKLSAKPAKEKFQVATASQAEVVTGNRDKNMLTSIDQRTSVDPTGEGGQEGKVDLAQLTQWENEVLGFSNDDGNIAARIGVLEDKVFGGQTFIGSLSARMANLKVGIKEWKKQHIVFAQTETVENAVDNAIQDADSGSSAIKDAIRQSTTAYKVTKQPINIEKETEEINKYLFD